MWDGEDRHSRCLSPVQSSRLWSGLKTFDDVDESSLSIAEAIKFLALLPAEVSRFSEQCQAQLFSRKQGRRHLECLGIQVIAPLLFSAALPGLKDSRETGAAASQIDHLRNCRIAFKHSQPIIQVMALHTGLRSVHAQRRPEYMDLLCPPGILLTPKNYITTRKTP